jgi:[ribosomal protein S18]-alanine N-acetyltransferase
VRLLVEHAAELGFDEIWLRVIPSNEAAIACYRGAGFVRAAPGVEASVNVGQPHEYVWMRFETAD